MLSDDAVKQAVWRCSYLPPPVWPDGVHRRQVWRADAAGQRAGRDQANLLSVLIVSSPKPLLYLAETQHNHVTKKKENTAAGTFQYRTIY